MKERRLKEASVLCLALVIGAYVLAVPLSYLTSPYSALNILVAGMFWVYIVFHLRHSNVCKEKVIVGASLAFGLLALAACYSAFLVIFLGSLLLWIVRIMVWHNSLMSAFADSAWIFLSSIFSIFILSATGSIYFGLLCLFGLYSCAFAWIDPAQYELSRGSNYVGSITSKEKFELAYKAAKTVFDRI